MKYKRLNNRHKECIKLYDKTENINYLQEDACIIDFFECEKDKTYEKILNFARKHKFKRIFDIGCALGHQSEVFLNTDIDYVGINEYDVNYWNRDRFKYISNKYPFKIHAKNTDLAVSVLCLTWNCYLVEGEKTLKEQCEALSRDFKSCLLYIAGDKINFVKKYYKNYTIIDEDFVYFSN